MAIRILVFLILTARTELVDERSGNPSREACMAI